MVRLNRAHIRNIPNSSFMYLATRICLVIFSLSFAHVSFSACIYHVSPASRTLAFTLVYSGLTGVANAPRISGDLNLIIIVVFANCCHV